MYPIQIQSRPESTEPYFLSILVRLYFLTEWSCGRFFLLHFNLKCLSCLGAKKERRGKWFPCVEFGFGCLLYPYSNQRVECVCSVLCDVYTLHVCVIRCICLSSNRRSRE